MQCKLTCVVSVTDYCQSNPCSNNGSCYNDIYFGRYTCYCPPGGINCEGTKTMSVIWKKFFELCHSQP